MDTKLLKQKILDLAIRGKLVPQDPNDEPASVLLERIRAEKEQLVQQGKIKKPKATAASDTQHYENVPFNIPQSWEWVRLYDVCIFENGYAFSSKEYKKAGIPLIRISNIQQGSIELSNAVFIQGEYSEHFTVSNGDLLIAMSGATTGKMGIYKGDKKAYLNQRVGNIKVIDEKILLPSFRNLFLNHQSTHILDLAYGGAQPNISSNMILQLCFPLPPLAEQKRIVTEIERWFTLIENLEENKQDLQAAIKQTRAKVLDLAIHGKLVPQDPNDEPASELLKRINPHYTPCDTSHYENLPKGWTVTVLKNICKTISTQKNQIKQSEIKKLGKYPVISQSANYIEGFCDRADKLYTENPIIVFGDHTRIVKFVDFEFVVGADGVKIFIPLLSPKYTYYLICYAASQIENKGYARHYCLLSKVPLLIPPVQEQNRIANNIDELFEIIDTISAEL